VTFAAGTICPEGSRTVPLIVPVTVILCDAGHG
jgi:hypothetical protein